MADFCACSAATARACSAARDVSECCSRRSCSRVTRASTIRSASAAAIRSMNSMRSENSANDPDDRSDVSAPVPPLS